MQGAGAVPPHPGEAEGQEDEAPPLRQLRLYPHQPHPQGQPNLGQEGKQDIQNKQAGHPAAGPAYYVLHPQKGITICLFFLTYQAFKKREGIVSQTNLAE